MFSMSDITATLVDDAFRKNPMRWSLFYASSGATLIMFIILCTLSAWSVHLGRQVSAILADVEMLIPEIKDSLSLLQFMCEADNFTKTYGPCPL